MLANDHGRKKHLAYMYLAIYHQQKHDPTRKGANWNFNSMRLWCKNTVTFLWRYVILDLLTCHHFRGANSDYQAHIYTLPIILQNYSFSLFTVSCNYLFCTHLLSVFLSSLNAPWAQRSCLFCLLSIASPWRLRRSIILIRTGQSLLW